MLASHIVSGVDNASASLPSGSSRSWMNTGSHRAAPTLSALARR